MRQDRLYAVCITLCIALMGEFVVMAANLPRSLAPVSCHALAAEQTVRPREARHELPLVALLGSLEARIYRCECGSGIHLWDVAGGLQLWAAAHGLQVTTRAAVLRGKPGDPKAADAIRGVPPPAP